MSRNSKSKSHPSSRERCRLGFEVLESRMLLAVGPEIAVQLGAHELPIGGSVDFGSVQQGASGRTRMFTVFNRGDQTLTLGTIHLPDGFRVKEGLRSTIRPHGSDTFTIEMPTNVAGFKVGELSFSNNDSNENPFHFTIAGQVNGRRTGGADLDVMRVSCESTAVWPGVVIDFGTTFQYGAVPPQTFRITNLGDQPLTLGNLEIPEGFRVIGRFGQAIAPGRSDFFTLVMKTDTPGFRSGIVRLTSNSVDEETFDFTVQGEVAQRNAAEVDVLLDDAQVRAGAVVDFGSAAPGAAPREQTFTVVNRGTRTLDLSGLEVPTGFRVKEGLSTKLLPGAHDTFTLEMITDTAADLSGTVRFVSNDPNESPFEFTVTGKVELPPLTAVATDMTIYTPAGVKVPNRSQLSFGSVKKGYSAPTKQLVIKNTGTTGLMIGNFELPSGSGFNVTKVGTPWPQPLAPGKSVTFNVSMSTNVVGSKSAPLTIRYGNNSEYSYVIVLTGNVTP